MLSGTTIQFPGFTKLHHCRSCVLLQQLNFQRTVDDVTALPGVNDVMTFTTPVQRPKIKDLPDLWQFNYGQ